MAKKYTTRETILKNIQLHKSGVYNYLDKDTGKTIRVLKTPELVKSLKDKVAMMPITDGHKGDMLIKDGYSATTGGGAIIGMTGSNARYDDNTTKLTVDCRIQKDIFNDFKSKGRLGISLGALGHNVPNSGVHPTFGAYDAVQEINEVSHIAVVDCPRVTGSRLEDEMEQELDQVVIMETLLLDGDNMSEVTEEVKPVEASESPQEEKKEDATEVKEEAAVVPSMASETAKQEEDSTKPNELEELKNFIINKFDDFDKRFGYLVNKEDNESKEEVEEIKQEEPKEEDTARQSLESLADAASSLLGGIPEEKKENPDKLMQYLAKKLDLKGNDALTVDYLRGVVNERLNYMSRKKEEKQKSINDENTPNKVGELNKISRVLTKLGVK